METELSSRERALYSLDSQARNDYCRALCRAVLRHADEDDTVHVATFLEGYAQELCEVRYLPGLHAATYDLYAHRVMPSNRKGRRRRAAQGQAQSAHADDLGNFAEALGADLRRCIFHILKENGEGATNDHTVQHLLSTQGHTLSLGRVRAELVEMEREGLVELLNLKPTWLVSARASDRNVKASGDAHVERSDSEVHHAAAARAEGTGESYAQAVQAAAAEDRKCRDVAAFDAPGKGSAPGQHQLAEATIISETMDRQDAIEFALRASRTQAATDATLCTVIRALGYGVETAQLRADLREMAGAGRLHLDERADVAIASLLPLADGAAPAA